jgi:hypothetical protein
MGNQPNSSTKAEHKHTTVYKPLLRPPDHLTTQATPAFPSAYLEHHPTIHPIADSPSSALPTMRLSLSAITCLAATTSAFMFDGFSEENCGGTMQGGINVYDGSCAEWVAPLKSFRFTVHGGSHQAAYFFRDNHCGNLNNVATKNWVDGGTSWQIGSCYNVGGTADAVASYNG